MMVVFWFVGHLSNSSGIAEIVGSPIHFFNNQAWKNGWILALGGNKSSYANAPLSVSPEMCQSTSCWAFDSCASKLIIGDMLEVEKHPITNFIGYFNFVFISHFLHSFLAWHKFYFNWVNTLSCWCNRVVIAAGSWSLEWYGNNVVDHDHTLF